MKIWASPRWLSIIAVIALLLPPLLPQHIPAARAAFPGSNGKITFASARDGNFEIYTMNSDGTGQTRLTNNAAIDEVPRWSPDGAKIAFESDRDGNLEIYVMNADGTGQTNLTNNPAFDADPAWSPDGSKLAFTSTRDGVDGEIYVMNADGTGATRLTNNAQLDFQPAWSPDGAKIAFSRRLTNQGPFDIFVMNADGTGQTNLTNSTDSTAENGDPAWSPDGAKIAFRSHRDGNGEIYVMNPDGTGVTRLTNNLTFDGNPAWSPDGTKIAFSRGFFDVFVMNADGSGATNLTPNTSDDRQPDWQPLPTADSDGDGIPDNEDDCPHSDLSATVIIDGCNSGVTNTVFPSGCTISDLIAECAESASNHGQFVSCVSYVTNDLKKAGTITGQQKGAIQRCAALADIP